MHAPRPSPINASLIVLIGVNLVPLWGAAFWGWSVFEIVALYWLENLVIGALNVVKIAAASPDLEFLATETSKRASGPASSSVPSEVIPTAFSPRKLEAIHHGAKIFLIPFFVFHYGMFCFVHGIFVFVLLGSGSGDPAAQMTSGIPGILGAGGATFLVAVVGSHLWSLAVNFFGAGEFRRTSAINQMAAPYGRVVVLHIAILFGAFAIAALGSPLPLLALLILGKIAMDAAFHVRSHRKLAARA